MGLRNNRKNYLNEQQWVHNEKKSDNITSGTTRIYKKKHGGPLNMNEEKETCGPLTLAKRTNKHILHIT